MSPSAKRSITLYEQTQLAKYHILQTQLIQNSNLPVEYLTKHVDFAGLTFAIDQRALIPRVETEELVNLGIAYIQNQKKQKNKVWQIADIGTGCGAMALAIAHQLLKTQINHQILATDISKEALELAMLNAEALRLTKTIKFQHLDLLEKLPASCPKFDLILANLPYIPTDRIPLLDKSVGEYEPKVALDGGPEGFSLIEKFLNQAKSKIKPNGLILLGIDYTHPDLLKSKFRQDWRIHTWVSPLSRCIFAQLQPKSKII